MCDEPPIRQLLYELTCTVSLLFLAPMVNKTRYRDAGYLVAPTISSISTDPTKTAGLCEVSTALFACDD